jgi:hypothetical protein
MVASNCNSYTITNNYFYSAGKHRYIHTDSNSNNSSNTKINSNTDISYKNKEIITNNSIIDSSLSKKNTELKIRQRKGKELIKKLFGATGYLSYKGFIALGYVDSLLENDSLLVNNLIPFLSSLKEDKVYTVLSVIRWINENGETQGLTMENSTKITCKNSPVILACRLHLDLNSVFTKYTLEVSDCELVLMYREWLDINEFTKGIDDIAKVIDTVISKEVNKTLSTTKLINKRLSISSINKYSHALRDNYGTEIIEDNKVIGYKRSSSEGLILNRKEGVNGLSMNFVTVKEIINGKLEDNCTEDNSNLIKWTDYKTDNGFIREINKIKLYFDLEGVIYKTEGEYYFPDFPRSDIVLDHDTKIGSLDFETYGNKGGNSLGDSKCLKIYI